MAFPAQRGRDHRSWYHGLRDDLHETGFEPVFTILGVAVLALGHRLNMMAKHAAY